MSMSARSSRRNEMVWHVYDQSGALRGGGMGSIVRRSATFGATFHPDSWDFDRCMYRVRDASEETIAELAAFYGVSVHDINVLNGTFVNNQGSTQNGQGNPAIYGAYVGAWINMPGKACELAKTLPCPAGWYGNPGSCSTNKPGVDIQPVNPPGGNPPGGQTTPAAPWSTTKKVVVGVTAVATVGAIGFGIYKLV